MRCAWARLHVETVPVNTHRTRFTRVPVRCMYGQHVCYRIGILYHGMSREYGRRLTREIYRLLNIHGNLLPRKYR